MNNLTVLEISNLNNLNTNTQKIGLGLKINGIISEINNITVIGTPVNAVNASQTLTILGVVIDGETVTIGGNVYEFLADETLSKSNPDNIGVDITAYVVKSQGTLTVDTQPSSGDTITIGEKTYIFTPVGTANAEGEISIGEDLTAAQTAIVDAINGTDGHNTKHQLVESSVFNANACTINALVGGVAGDLIATTENFTAVTNIFSGVTLGSGADCSASNAVTALVGAITGSDTQGVGAADGVGDTVVLTADIAGVIGNSITISETMTNGEFNNAETTLSGGVDGTVSEIGTTMIDVNYLYRCVADNTTSGKNWRRVSLGSAY